ncbi:FAD-linked oxidase-like protein [Chiua virens]|nr:FAD-linked oxidase-like protein [Chiua virens]
MCHLFGVRYSSHDHARFLLTETPTLVNIKFSLSCVMFRSRLLRAIPSRSGGNTSTHRVLRPSFRPFEFAVPRSRHASTSGTSAPSRTTSSFPVLLGALTCALIGYTIGSSTTLPSSLAFLGLGRQQVPTDDEPIYGTPADFQKAIQELRQAFSDGDQNSGIVSTDPEDLRVHGFSENDYHPGALHTVVVYPTSTEDVVKIVKIATKYRMPITPFSGGTSLEGNYRGHATGGICVDMSNMDKILEIHEQDSDIVCQPGVGWMEINETLQKKGIPLFFPLDPGPGATIGGMMSTGCSGTNAVRYGTAKGEWFLNATVVLPSGEVIKTRQRARKSSAGFDVTKLFIGAEGTLGIITEVTIRLTPVLPTTVAVVQFPNVKKATEAVIDVMNRGVGIQCVELCDSEFMRSTNLFGASERTYPEVDSLFFKFQGPTQASIKETAHIVKEIVKRHGATGFELARNEKEAKDLWADRKNALYSGLALLEGSRGWSTDVCVPVSRLPDLVYETKQDIQQLGLVSTIVGHVGDGNFHALLLFQNDVQLAKAREAVHRMVERAIRMEGTCTGEHGVGIGKREYLYSELGQGTVDLMRSIKKTIDPLGLFNPGKLYPDKSMKNPEKR